MGNRMVNEMAAKSLLRVGLPLVTIFAGVAAMLILSHMREEAGRHGLQDSGALVEVVEAVAQDYRVTIRATGVVRARRWVQIAPQVAGRVVWVAPGFVEGGRFRKGEKLIQIERKDYLIALKDAEAKLSRALQELEVARNRSAVERRQWERLHPDGEEPPTSLVFYEPQFKAAEAAVEAARAAREKAALDLQRTEIKAPFDCRISAKKVDVGAYVRSGTVVAEVVGEEMAEAVVPVPPGDVMWLELPAYAEVRLLDEGGKATWKGRAVRFLPEVDPAGRLPRLLVEIPHPFPDGGRSIGLAQESFVEVLVAGKRLERVYLLPAKALRRGNAVWIAGSDGLLHVKKVELLRREEGKVVVRGLDDGDRVITTMIQGAAPGMKVREAGKGGS